MYDLTTLYNKIETVSNKIIRNFAPVETISISENIMSANDAFKDDYSIKRFENIYDGVIKTAKFRKTADDAKIEKIVDESKRYDIINTAIVIFNENVEYGRSKRFSYTLSVVYMMGHLEKDMLKIPNDGLTVERIVDQSKRSPLWFLIKNYFVIIVRVVLSIFTVYKSIGQPFAPIIYGLSFFVSFSVLTNNLLLLIRLFILDGEVKSTEQIKPVKKSIYGGYF